MAIKTIIPYISTFVVLIPFFLGIVKVKHAQYLEKIVLTFLLLGFIIDISYLYINADYGKWVLLGYSLAEAFFFFWIVFKISGSGIVKKLSFTLLFVTPVLWILQWIIQKAEIHHLAFFDLYYNIASAFLSGFGILFFIEKAPDPFRQSRFWILAAIFFYCMCSFFIIFFINAPFAKQFWFLHDSVNIITSLLFAKAFFVMGYSNGTIGMRVNSNR